MVFKKLAQLTAASLAWSSPEQQRLQLENTKAADNGYFHWAAIKPSTSFKWHDCFGDFKCARLQVPMDWQGHSDEANKTVELAVIKVEATVSVTDPTYGGAVILNPGGPGGSGIGQVLRAGKNVRTLLSAGPESSNGVGKHFDVYGFDPRGVNNTTPTIICQPDSIAAGKWQIETNAYGYIGTSDTSFDNGIAKHVSTAAVARDIVEIFERHASERRATLARTVYKKGAEMVQYLGFSYGTILGATLSAMYPDRIHRAVLDGVADSFDYMAGGWSTNLPDTDLEFVKLGEYCWLGGPTNCPLYDEDGPAAIIDNLAKIIANFIHEPIGIPGDAISGPVIVTYNDLKRVFRDIVYHPLREFTVTAQILYDISQRNGSSLAAYKRAHFEPSLDHSLSERCLSDGPYSEACGGDDGAASFAIACSDGQSRLDQTKESYREYAREIQSQSRLIGEEWAVIQLACTAWHARPAWRYDGNFTAKTAHPILFVGNTVDPVTPRRNIALMKKGFVGAGELHVDTEGHCTYATVSMCAGRGLREYFQSGKLPEAEKGDKMRVCSPDRLPFDGYTELEDVPLPEGETDVEMWEALVGLNRVWP
ncbi:hypothetical protein B0A48_04443 [Cryoendolithus antarcticus]|uniref:Peptidase S33 tripeptidyl aminopeptidase-like C-terminal domain-containing protein n=1 Tax=Cryoendolithus antarcticus TaxID=1507870 RepID=A0A1V8TFC8_9PEZI|nr:hypothetical protein B0A48_04443 [Cryoendolithus antarcticus]